MRFALPGTPLARTVRLWGGLTLFTYVLLHLGNHALGLISLGAMERGLTWAVLLWRSPPGVALLYSALVTHLGLGLWALYRRRTLRMPPREAVQLVLGLAIPAILLSHIAGTRVTDALLGTTPSYARVLLCFWVFDPGAGARQVCLLLIAWIHGCVGLHFWLQFRRWYPRMALPLFAGALLLPVLACWVSPPVRERRRLSSPRPRGLPAT
jgi:adenylate cyclase